MNIYVIIDKAPGDDMFMHVFDNEDLFRYSTSEKLNYSPAMVDEALSNEQVSRNQYTKNPKTITRQEIEEEFKNHQIYPGELSRVIGAKYIFFSISDYTKWLMQNKQMNVVETFEGISC